MSRRSREEEHLLQLKGCWKTHVGRLSRSLNPALPKATTVLSSQIIYLHLACAPALVSYMTKANGSQSFCWDSQYLISVSFSLWKGDMWSQGRNWENQQAYLPFMIWIIFQEVDLTIPVWNDSITQKKIFCLNWAAVTKSKRAVIDNREQAPPRTREFSHDLGADGILHAWQFESDTPAWYTTAFLPPRGVCWSYVVQSSLRCLVGFRWAFPSQMKGCRIYTIMCAPDCSFGVEWIVQVELGSVEDDVLPQREVVASDVNCP